MTGLIILLIGNVLVVYLAFWLALISFGLSLVILPAAWMLCIGLAAFRLPDRAHGG